MAATLFLPPGCSARAVGSVMTVRQRSLAVTPWLQGLGAKRVRTGGCPEMVAEVRNDEGQDKPDGALKAAKRVIPRLRQAPPHLALLIGGEDLYGHAPLIGQLRAHRRHHVLVRKPGAHAAVYREVEAQDALGAWERGEWPAGPACRRRVSAYRVARGVALTETGRGRGTFVEGWSHTRAGKQRYHNAWFPDREGRADQVAESVSSGRARWQIEQEPCNGQQNHGDELPQNDGPGQQTVSRGGGLPESMGLYCSPELGARGPLRSARRSDDRAQRAVAHVTCGPAEALGGALVADLAVSRDDAAQGP